MARIFWKLLPPKKPNNWRSITISHWKLGDNQYVVIKENKGKDMGVDYIDSLFHKEHERSTEENKLVVVNSTPYTSVYIDVLDVSAELIWIKNGFIVWKIDSLDSIKVKVGEEVIHLPVKLYHL